MKKTIDGLKWVSVSITVASLVTVFWVWPAWNSGSQTWYLGNNQDSMNTMYRNTHPPSGHNAPFEFTGSFMGAFMANEPANQMLTFGFDPPWQYQIEWYLDPDGGIHGIWDGDGHVLPDHWSVERHEHDDVCSLLFCYGLRRSRLYIQSLRCDGHGTARDRHDE